MADAPLSPTACHACHRDGLTVLDGFEALTRVTSDCKPWPAGGRLAVCRGCGTVQKPLTTEWRAECDAIYTGYTIYQMWGGQEQPVFAGADGAAASRSSQLMRKLADGGFLPETGRMLDVGCGSGTLFHSFRAVRPNWSMAGSELGDQTKAVVEAIPGVEKLYVGPFDDIPGRFDLITLVHCLEHVPDPSAFLRELSKKLTPTGVIVVDVPDHARNPYDLLIADHCTHFTRVTLADAAVAGGLDLQACTEEWIAKELVMVGRAGGAGLTAREADPEAAETTVRAQLARLARLTTVARDMAARGPLGVFGTSIAGTWLSRELGDSVQFFVDEDPGRHGRTLAGKPILAPAAAPVGAQVLIGLAPEVAELIKPRVDGYAQATWHLPPA
jgi:SAM-dependent methyltransferase